MKYMAFILAVMMSLAVAYEPAFAQAAGSVTAIDNVLQAIIDLMSGKTATLIMTIALMICGYMLVFRQADMMAFGSAFVGIAFVLAAAQLAAMVTKS